MYDKFTLLNTKNVNLCLNPRLDVDISVYLSLSSDYYFVCLWDFMFFIVVCLIIQCQVMQMLLLRILFS